MYHTRTVEPRKPPLLSRLIKMGLNLEVVSFVRLIISSDNLQVFGTVRKWSSYRGGLNSEVVLK